MAFSIIMMNSSKSKQLNQGIFYQIGTIISGLEFCVGMEQIYFIVGIQTTLDFCQ